VQRHGGFGLKTVGIIGGVGPESTIDYYRSIIEECRKQKPDGSYPLIIINSINLTEMIGLLESNQLDRMAERLVDEIDKLACAGADFALLSSNTPHIVFDQIASRSSLPLISIVRATCDAAKSMGLKRLGLFGSGFTMRARFFPEIFTADGMQILMPAAEEQTYIHTRYMDELVKGVFRDETRAGLLAIVDRMKKQDGIQGLILGGTELPLILRNVADQGIPFLDTTQIHVKAAVKEMLS
jgi:aspartate racemase